MNTIRFGNTTPPPFYLTPQQRGKAQDSFGLAEILANNALKTENRSPYETAMAGAVRNLAEGLKHLTNADKTSYPQAYYDTYHNELLYKA